MKIIKSIDSVLIDRPTDPGILDSAVSAVQKDKNPKLTVTIDATHSGVLTNRRVYPGKHVSVGYKSFFSKASGGSSEYDKPVLKHHDLFNDPIGRVTNAIFTAYKTGKDFDEDFKSPDPMGGKGSGVVTITAKITDLESIQKIIDGRYLSVSAGHSTDSMTCSICNKSIMKCDHYPGQYYDIEGEPSDAEDGFMCFYITGNMNYDEISFVNMPAQPPAKLLNHRWEDFNKADFSKDTLVIESMTRGKKSLVRDFSLVDDDSEYNLLKGTQTDLKKKVIVAMNNQASKNCDVPDVTINVPQENSKKSVAKDAPIADSNRKDSKMDKETPNGLDVNTLQASLQALTDKVTTLEASKTDATQKIADLESKLATKTSEIERLTKANTDMQVEVCKSLATGLASFRMKLAKPDTVGIDSPEKFNEYVEKLAKRTADSLKDAISDTVLEINQVKNSAPASESKESGGAKSLISDKKVDNPSLSANKDKENVRAGQEQPSKTSDKPKTAIDKVLS